MQTLTLLPSAAKVCTVMHRDRRVGELIFVGTGQFADVTLQILCDPAMLGQLEAAIARTRQHLVAEALA